MFLNDDIVDMKKADEICSPNFVVDELSGLFLHSSMFSIKHLRLRYKSLYFHILFYVIRVYFLF